MRPPRVSTVGERTFQMTLQRTEGRRRWRFRVGELRSVERVGLQPKPTETMSRGSTKICFDGGLWSILSPKRPDQKSWY